MAVWRTNTRICPYNVLPTPHFDTSSSDGKKTADEDSGNIKKAETKKRLAQDAANLGI